MYSHFQWESSLRKFFPYNVNIKLSKLQCHILSRNMWDTQFPDWQGIKFSLSLPCTYAGWLLTTAL